MLRLTNNIEGDARSRDRLTLLLLGSAIAHGVLVFLVGPRLSFTPATPPAVREIEIADLATLKKLERMAETEDAQNKEEDPNAKFLGEKTQKALKDMRANVVDDFRKKSGAGTTPATPGHKAVAPPQGAKSLADQLKATDVDGIDAANGAQGKPRNWKTLSLRDLTVPADGGLAAATDDRLEDVEKGDRTVLSTREYKYYSYYHRIKELLRQHWKPRVEQKMLLLWNKGKEFGEDELVTRVLVQLDKSGQIRDIARVGSSGVNDLDDAAVESFQRAAPFPNPPKGIIEADGIVRIRWDFILKTEAAPRIQFQTNRQPSRY